MKFAVIVFPGTNNEADCFHVVRDVLHQPVRYVWHKETDLSDFDCLILPGGFSYGDYLRAGAIARFSPVMKAVERFAGTGGLVIGICNGFQILTESGLLPGALTRNDSLQFRCQWVQIRVESSDLPHLSLCSRGQVLRMPIAHGAGSYYADSATLQRLKANDQIVVRYCVGDGTVTRQSNPNGSVENIAGICNKDRNVFGLMPHPDRCAEAVLGGVDGLLIFESILTSWRPPGPPETQTQL
ncbi:MAG: phosphoribosylformylglycinamidine synthase subunit PurQ [Chloroflexi bacterium]|nr:phosphoribosylformylglycinamidine synthase subunit PurQ [Chloroflexota bacterium]